MARAVAPLRVGTTTPAGDDAANTASTLSERRSAVLYSVSRGRVFSRSHKSARIRCGSVAAAIRASVATATAYAPSLSDALPD